ncbi:RHS repeat protein [bacterium]|nr:RHS repeat protein [bacterium]
MKVQNSYDANGRLFRMEATRNNQTITEDYGFDTFGRVTSVKTTDPENSSRYRLKFYNTGGQIIWEADEESDGSRNDFNYLNILDVEVGNQKYYTYNAFGDLEKTVYVMTNTGIGLASPDINPWLNNGLITTNFTYDIFGRITSRTNDRSGVTAYSYYDENPGTSHSLNKLQRIQIIPAVDNNSNYTDSTQTYTYTYDEKGDEESVEYTEGNNYSMEVAFTRDAYGRIISKTSNGSVPVTQTFTYNMRNLLETATDTVGNAAATSVTRLYDSFGNPHSETVSSNNVTKTVSRRMTDVKTYQFTCPDGKTLRKTATGSDLDSIEYNNSEIASYNRANGVLTAVTKGQNLIETFSYNNWNMLDNHNIKKSQTDVYDMSYNYSRGWHLIEKADGIKNTSDKYTYDSYYRLKEVKYDFANNTAARTDNFYQDGVHNIEQSTENGTTFAWGVDKLNRLRDKKVGNNTEVAYGYDERNNMISEDRSGTTDDRTYIYDDLNRLIEVKDGSNQTIATYTYDAFNRRITKTAGTTTERYTYDDWDIVEISTNSDDYTNIIDSGTDRHIAIEVTANNTSTLYYFLTDERGNVTALTDATGNVLERYRYRVYGDFEILDTQFTPKNCSNQTCYATNLHNFLWGGSLYEPETNLYWMRNRYYHIDMHRFINQDPIGIWGDANNLGNGFAYVAGMVIEASDPSGLDTNIGGTGNDGLSFGYYSSASNSESASTFLSVETLVTSVAGLVGEIAVSYVVAGTAAQSVALTFAQANVIAATADVISGIASFRIPDLNSKAHLISVFGEESAEIIVSIGNQLAKSVGAKGFHYKDNGDGTVDLTAVGKDGKETKKTINLEEEKMKRDLEEADKFEEPPTSKDIDLKNEESSSIGTSNERSVDPDSGEDMFQRYLRAKILKKRLKVDDNSDQDKPLIVIETETPIGKTKIVVHNPYYKNIDPLKRLMKGKDPNSRTLIFNPFLPPESTEYRNTYEKITQGGGIIMPNVDPYLW